MNNHFSIVEYLLANGANVNANEGFGDGTPLHNASYSEHLEIVKYLLNKGADKNIKDFFGKTPLEISKEINLEEIFSLLSKDKC